MRGGGRAVQQFTAQFPEIVFLLEDTGRKPQQEQFIFDWIEQSCMLWRSLQGSFCFGPSDSMEIVVNSFCRQEVKKNDDCNCISTASWDQLFVCLGYFRSTKWMRWSRVCRSVGHQAHPSTIKRQPHHWMPMDPVDPFVDNGTQGLKLRGHEGWKVLGPRLIYS